MGDETQTYNEMKDAYWNRCMVAVGRELIEGYDTHDAIDRAYDRVRDEEVPEPLEVDGGYDQWLRTVVSEAAAQFHQNADVIKKGQLARDINSLLTGVEVVQEIERGDPEKSAEYKEELRDEYWELNWQVEEDYGRQLGLEKKIEFLQWDA